MRRGLALITFLYAGCAFGERDAPDGSAPDLVLRDLGIAGLLDQAGPPRDLPPRDLEDRDLAGASTVALNEAFADGAGMTPDYGEVKNLGNVPVDLSGFKVGDDSKDLALPAGTIIPARGYLVVYFASPGAGPPGLYTGFGLSQGGDELHLRYPDGQDIVPPLRWGAAPLPGLEKARGYGRLPDGTGPFAATTPTPGAENRP